MKAEQVVIAPGMREDIDPRLLPIGTPRLLQNVRVRQGARFEHRPGQTALVASGLPSSGQANWFGSVNGTPLVGISETVSTSRQDNGVYGYNGQRFTYLGRHGHCVPHRRFGVAGREQSSPYNHPGVVAANGLLYATFTDPSGPTIYIVEMTPEGQTLRSQVLDAGDYMARIVWTGSALYLITNASATVKVREISLVTFNLGGATSLSTAAQSSTTMLEVANLEGSTDWLLMYATSSTELLVRRMTGATVTNEATITTTNQSALYAVAGKDGQSIVAIYPDGTDAQATIFTSALGGASEITISSIAGNKGWTQQFALARTDSTEYAALLAGHDDSPSAPNLDTGFTVYVLINTAGSSSTEQFMWHWVPASKPMRVGADGDAVVYCWMHNDIGDWDGVFQTRHILAVFEPISGSADGYGAQCAGISYEHQATINALLGTIGAVADLGDGRFAALLNWRDPGHVTGVDCAVFSLAAPTTSMAQAHRFVESAGGAFFVSGGILSDVADAPYSKECLMPENNFTHPPLVTAAIASGGVMTAGQAYNYLACYRRMDGKGRVQRSAAVINATGIVPTGVHRRANVYVTTLGLSNRWQLPGEPPVAEVYRSWNGGPYYFVSATSTVEPVESTVTIVDAATDDSLIDEDGALDEQAAQPESPSGARLIKQWGTRLAAVGWVENEVQLSKTYRPDTSWEFVDEDTFRVPIPQPITALGWLDGIGVVFTAEKIYAVAGDGPDDRGSGAFDEARPLPVSVGASSPHIVETPAGLMYYGAGTIWLLPRGFGAPVPVGDAIQKTLEAYPYLRGAVRCANDEYDLTHFLLSSGDLPASPTLVAVWDNKLNAWSRDQLSCDIGAIGAVDGVLNVLLATWSALSAKPVRKLQDAVSDLNNSGTEVWNEMRVGFGDFRPYGPHGWGRLDRFQVHGEVAGLCDMNVVSVVEGVTGMNARGVTALATKHMTGVGQFYAENAIAYPPGGAYGFEIYDSGLGSNSTNMTSGLVLHSVAFAPGEPQGLRKLSDGERF